MKQADSKVTGPSALSSDDILVYLHEHPEFLQQHPEILEHQALDHACGDATSLLERQIKVLRQRIQDYANKLSELLQTARRNDVQFDKTKRLVTELGGCQTLTQMVDALQQSFITEFQADTVKLIVLQEIQEQHPDLIALASTTEQYTLLAPMAAKTWAFCSPVADSPLADILANTPQPMQSCAVLPIQYQERALGLVVIASTAKDHYTEELDTLFLNHVAAVCSRVLSRICG
ncbi:MAG: DUF484 family protein [Gammaproteobacteria bacterium]|jgi:hypothetical protein|nr:DUF484 family protein [Gammaproteobacteria bacterium]